MKCLRASWVLVATALVISACVASSGYVGGEPLETPLSPGCGPSKAPVVAKGFESFTPVKGRRGPLGEDPFRRDRVVVTSIDDVRIVGLSPLLPKGVTSAGSLQLLLLDPPDELFLYYAQDPPSETETVASFLAKNGLFVLQRPYGGISVDDSVADLKDRAVVVEVSRYRAMLTHADPVGQDDVRPYYLTWSDDARSWTLIGNVASAQDLIDFARSIYC